MVEVTALVRQLERDIAAQLVPRARQSVAARLRDDEGFAVRDDVDGQTAGPSGGKRPVE